MLPEYCLFSVVALFYPADSCHREHPLYSETHEMLCGPPTYEVPEPILQSGMISSSVTFSSGYFPRNFATDSGRKAVILQNWFSQTVQTDYTDHKICHLRNHRFPGCRNLQRQTFSSVCLNKDYITLFF